MRPRAEMRVVRARLLRGRVWVDVGGMVVVGYVSRPCPEALREARLLISDF